MAPFFFAVRGEPPWNLVGLVAFALSVGGQLWWHRQILEGCLGGTAGITLAMWGVHVAGYQDKSRPNIALAIVLVAAQIVLILAIESVKRWRRDRLTPPPGNT